MSEQLMLSFSATVVQVPGPNGSITLRPGKVIAKRPDMTVKEVAKATGYDVRTIRMYIHAGLIKGAWRFNNVRGGKWQIPAASVDALRFPEAGQ
jgi:excisionase family DNA binding protein